MRTELSSATVSGPAARVATLRAAADDLAAAAKVVGGLTFVEADDTPADGPGTGDGTTLTVTAEVVTAEATT